MKIAILRAFAGALLYLGSCLSTWAQQVPAVAVVSQVLPFAVSGTVTSLAAGEVAAPVATSSSTTAMAVDAATLTQAGGKISTGADGAASLLLGATGTARMGMDSEVMVPSKDEAEHSLELLKGRLFMNVNGDELKKRAATEFKLKTPTALLAVKGTKFFAISVNGSDVIGVHEGSVDVMEPTSGKSVTVGAGNAVTVSPGVISETRLITDEEKTYTQEYAAADLVRTPMPLVVKTPVPNTKKLQILLFQNGRLSVVGEENMDRINHGTILESKIGPYLDWKALSQGNVGSRFSPRLTDEGIIHYAWPDSSVGGGGYGSTVRLLFEYRGQAKVVKKPVAIQFRMRTSNVTKAGFMGGGGPGGYGPSLPLRTSVNGGWTEVQMLPKKQRNIVGPALSFIYNGIEISTLKAGEKRTLPTKQPVSFELTDFVLLSLPK